MIPYSLSVLLSVTRSYANENRFWGRVWYHVLWRMFWFHALLRRTNTHGDMRGGEWGDALIKGTSIGLWCLFNWALCASYGPHGRTLGEFCHFVNKLGEKGPQALSPGHLNERSEQHHLNQKDGSHLCLPPKIRSGAFPEIFASCLG